MTADLLPAVPQGFLVTADLLRASYHLQFRKGPSDGTPATSSSAAMTAVDFTYTQLCSRSVSKTQVASSSKLPFPAPLRFTLQRTTSCSRQDLNNLFTLHYAANHNRQVPTAPLSACGCSNPWRRKWLLWTVNQRVSHSILKVSFTPDNHHQVDFPWRNWIAWKLWLIDLVPTRARVL